MKVWASCEKWTVYLYLDDKGIIRWGAPLMRQFIGHPFSAVREWCKREGWKLTAKQL